MIHNRKRIPLSNLLINCIYEGSAPQILSLKNEYNFTFSNFIILLANCSFDKVLFLMIPPANVLAQVAEECLSKVF